MGRIFRAPLTLCCSSGEEWDMNGHAHKAKELLDQANREIKMAAETANRDRR